MLVISDTTAITSLLTIDLITILKDLFEIIIIPSAVERELLKEHTDIPDFIIVESIRDNSAVNTLLKYLDPGEAEAIVLSKEKKADLLLIDEQKGRKIAKQEGIKIIGLLGVLLMAKQKKLIESVKQVIELLEQKTGFWISKEIKAFIIEQAGEDL